MSDKGIGRLMWNPSALYEKTRNLTAAQVGRLVMDVIEMHEAGKMRDGDVFRVSHDEEEVENGSNS
jgi:cation transport regulator ChaC